MRDFYGRSETQAMPSTPVSTVSVHALSAGSLTLPERFFIHPSDPTARRTVPSMCFLIQHVSPEDGKRTRIVFDLGIRRDASAYADPIRRHLESRQPMTTEPDVTASLAEGGLSPRDIDYVILSHVHWDHIGTPSDFRSPGTKFVVGFGALDLLSGKTQPGAGGHSHFEADLLPAARTIELPSPSATPIRAPLTESQSSEEKVSSMGRGKNGLEKSPLLPLWSSLPLLPHTIDFFGDGSLYIVDAPGHLAGHINALARIPASRSGGDGGQVRFVYLAGDACHDVRLFTGERSIAEWEDDQGRTCSIHADKKAAEETICRIRSLAEAKDERLGKVEIVFAHDADWEKRARESGMFWPGML